MVSFLDAHFDARVLPITCAENEPRRIVVSVQTGVLLVGISSGELIQTPRLGLSSRGNFTIATAIASPAIVLAPGETLFATAGGVAADASFAIADPLDVGYDLHS